MAATPSRARPRELRPGRWDYGQTAIAATFRHSRPHAGITTELHRRAGPLTTVPLPGNASSLVWVEDPERAARLARLGRCSVPGRACLAPAGPAGLAQRRRPARDLSLAGLTAVRMGQNRVALVGEAAHVMPPIGAQGLNLGLRDAAALAECVGAAHARGQDIGGRATLAGLSCRARRRRARPHHLGRSPQPFPAGRFPARAGPARPRVASACQRRAAAPAAHARRMEAPGRLPRLCA